MITFYCTTGTKELLLAARRLRITDIYFEMPDLLEDDYLILQKFPQLTKVRFEHVMDDEWIKRLESKLPNVAIDAPVSRPKEPTMAQWPANKKCTGVAKLGVLTMDNLSSRPGDFDR